MSISVLSGPIAVVDVETTGLFPNRHDRVVEVAIVVMRADGSIDREFESLINPIRDIGPSSIHGITSEDVSGAPAFSEIAPLLLDAMNGVVAIAGHNVRFDVQFLESEFSRIGHQFPECFRICTMELAGGGRLEDCCRDHGFPIEAGPHRALPDARAAARLLFSILSDQPRTLRSLRQLSPIHWPMVPKTGKRPVTRSEARRRQTEPPTFVQRLLRLRSDHALPDATDGAVIAYGALLDRALEDRLVDDTEADSLVEMAEKWGVNGEQIARAHRGYLDQLAITALLDGNVTETEQHDLNLVARLLGVAKYDMGKILSEAALKLSEAKVRPPSAESVDATLVGKHVCFTGESQCKLAGQSITREVAEDLATKAGLVVVDSVTKKCDLLVLADPHSQSGKAAKARRYGIRTMHERVFWKSIGIHV